jgi:hypothetical protein
MNFDLNARFEQLAEQTDDKFRVDLRSYTPSQLANIDILDVKPVPHENILDMMLLQVFTPRAVISYDYKLEKYIVRAGLEVLETAEWIANEAPRGRARSRCANAEIQVAVIDAPYMTEEKIQLAIKKMGY